VGATMVAVVSDLRSPPPGSDVLALAEKARRASLTKANLEKLVAALQRQVAEKDALLAALTGLGDERPVRAIEAVPAKQGTLPQAAYISLLSDAHLDERVRPAEVRHLNEFTPEIAHERMQQFWQKNLTMLHTARKTWDVRTYVQWLGGDLQTGWIHDELVSENYLSPFEAAEFVYDEVEAGLKFLLDRSDCERIVVVTSNGNHGRNTDKMWASGSWRNSYEYHIYKFLLKRFADTPRIEFQLGQGYENHLTVHGLRIRFHHGDEVKYKGGVGGIYPALYRRINEVNSGPDKADLDCLGHHHRLGFGPRAFTNGSVIGFNHYAATKGFAPEEPQQASFVVDAVRQIPVAMWPILVNEPRRASRK
jgi:hypothetical protein